MTLFSGPTDPIRPNLGRIQSLRQLWIVSKFKPLALFASSSFTSLRKLMFYFILLFKMSLLALMHF